MVYQVAIFISAICYFTAGVSLIRRGQTLGYAFLGWGLGNFILAVGI